MNNVLRNYHGKRILVTGGLGFIGSNLAIRLVGLGVRVTVIDSSVPGCGADEANLGPVRDSLTVLHRDIGDTPALESHIRSAALVFNLAGEISHIHSMKWPCRDAELNALAQLRFLECCARVHPNLRIVYAGTRQIYGKPLSLPVDENHPFRPVDFNGVHKAAAVQYHLLCAEMGQLDAVVLNLTNIYGPRMALWEPCQGFLGTFLRRMLLRQPLEVFGDGRQLRDPLYVDDAIDAFLLAGAAPQLPSKI
ncbi:MAG: NAD-dependent epimerase/dehydratase family protein [Bryobacteraceae bacterium]